MGSGQLNYLQFGPSSRASLIPVGLVPPATRLAVFPLESCPATCFFQQKPETQAILNHTELDRNSSRSCKSGHLVKVSAVEPQGSVFVLCPSRVLSWLSPLLLPHFSAQEPLLLPLLIPAYYRQLHLRPLFGQLPAQKHRGNLVYLVLSDGRVGGRGRQDREGPRVRWLSMAVSRKALETAFGTMESRNKAEERPCGR